MTTTSLPTPRPARNPLVRLWDTIATDVLSAYDLANNSLENQYAMGGMRYGVVATIASTPLPRKNLGQKLYDAVLVDKALRTKKLLDVMTRDIAPQHVWLIEGKAENLTLVLRNPNKNTGITKDQYEQLIALAIAHDFKTTGSPGETMMSLGSLPDMDTDRVFARFDGLDLRFTRRAAANFARDRIVVDPLIPA